MRLLRALLAGSALWAGLVLGQTSASADAILFPPQHPDDTVLSVHAGDFLNITWFTTWDKVNLNVDASAPNGSALNTPPSFTTGLPGKGFVSYQLDASSFMTSNLSSSITARCRLTNSADQTQFVESKNFTVNQLEAAPAATSSKAPGPATWTGSVTLYASAGVTATSTPPGATIGSNQDKRAEAAVATTTSAATTSGVTSTTASPAAASTATVAAAGSGGLSQQAKIGIGLGVTFGVLALAASAAALYMIHRRRPRRSGYSTTFARRWPSRSASDASHVSISRPEMIQRVAFDNKTGTWGPAPPEARFATEKKRKTFKWAVEAIKHNGQTDGLKVPEPAAGFKMPTQSTPLLVEMYAGPPSAKTIGELPTVASPRPPKPPPKG